MQIPSSMPTRISLKLHTSKESYRYKKSLTLSLRSNEIHNTHVHIQQYNDKFDETGRTTNTQQFLSFHRFQAITQTQVDIF
jgi:hypothetical protein